jgi:hypothetical protein
LRVTFVEMRVLDLKHDSDDVLCGGAESIHAYSRADDGDRLDHLAAELLVLGARELAEISDQELDGLLEERNKVLAHFLDNGTEGG